MMRKANQKIKDKTIIEEILQNSKICRLGISNNEFPYVLPFNYGYSDNNIYIHCALTGKKIDFLRKNPNVCFEIEQTAELVKNNKACKWTTTYRSIMGYGKIEILDDFSQKQEGLEIIMTHNGAHGTIEFEYRHVDSVLILKLTIDSLTGKQSGNWNKQYDEEKNKIETERLVLSEIFMTDLENIHKLHSVPKVDEYNTLEIPQTIEETRKLIKQIIQSRFKIPKNSYTWKICLKNSNQFIGLAGFTLSNDKFKLGEIYYKLHPNYWKNGYATEVAKQLVRKGFDDFNLQKMEASIATENIKSIRVLEKIGMTKEDLLPIRGVCLERQLSLCNCKNR